MTDIDVLYWLSILLGIAARGGLCFNTAMPGCQVAGLAGLIAG